MNRPHTHAQFTGMSGPIRNSVAVIALEQVDDELQAPGRTYNNAGAAGGSSEAQNIGGVSGPVTMHDLVIPCRSRVLETSYSRYT